MSHSPDALRSMASHASLRSMASRQTFETAATRGLCFCGEPISPSLAPTRAHGASDEDYASDDEDDAPIYCSVACARADALQALLAGSSPISSASLAAPAMEASLSTDSASTCGPLTPTNATFALPSLPAAPTQFSATAAKRESRARVLHRASVALQSMYPDLQFNLDAQLNLDAPLEAECARWEQEQLAATPSPVKMLGGSSHYRRVQALRPVVEFNPLSDSEEEGSDSDDGASSQYHSQRSTSSVSSAYVSVAPTHASAERESARLAALDAVAKGHARKASELSESQWTTSLTYGARKGHAHMNSDSSVSSMSSAGSTWSVPSTQASSDRSRSNTLDSSAQPCAEALQLFCINPDVNVTEEELSSPPKQVKLAPTPLPLAPSTDREQVLRLELAALDAELDATFEAFEYDDDRGASNINSFAYDLGDGWGHEDPVGWNQGEDNGLGLELGNVMPGSTPMPSCDVFGLAITPPSANDAAAPVSLLAALELQPAVTPKPRTRPDLKPIDVEAASALPCSVFEPYSPVLTPPCSASKGHTTATFTSLFKRTVSLALSPPSTPQRSSSKLLPPSNATTPTRRDSHERELAERLVGRIDAVLRGRWSSAKSPTATRYADSAVESLRRPSLGHKRSRPLLSALNI